MAGVPSEEAAKLRSFSYLDATQIDWLTSQIEGSLVEVRSEQKGTDRSGKVSANAEVGGGILAALGIKLGGSSEVGTSSSTASTETRALTTANKVWALRGYLMSVGQLPSVRLDHQDALALVDRVAGNTFVELEGSFTHQRGPRGTYQLHSQSRSPSGGPLVVLELSERSVVKGPFPGPGEHSSFVVLAELVIQRGLIMGAPIGIWRPRTTAEDARSAFGYVAERESPEAGAAQPAPKADPDVQTAMPVEDEQREMPSPGPASDLEVEDSPDLGAGSPPAERDGPTVLRVSSSLGPREEPADLQRQALEWLTPEEEREREAEKERRAQEEADRPPGPADRIEKFDVRKERQRIRVDDTEVTRVTLLLRLYPDEGEPLYFQLASDLPSSPDAHWPTDDTLYLELGPTDRAALGVGAVEVLATDEAVELRLGLQSPFGPVPCTTTLQVGADGVPQFGEVLIAGRHAAATTHSYSSSVQMGLGSPPRPADA